MLRHVAGWRQDGQGDWIADLACLHSQHVRHHPPLWPRPWVLTEEGRNERIGSELSCVLCDRAELPGDLTLLRVAGPFDADSLPAGIKRAHRVADGVWGRLRVLAGTAEFTFETQPPETRRLAEGETQGIPPGRPHRVSLGTGARIEVEFLGRG